MTERLTALLQDEVSALDIPAPLAGAVLSRGRRLRRRRRWVRAAAGVAGVALVATGTAVVVDRAGQPDAIDPAHAAAAYASEGAFAVGVDLYVGEEHFTWPEPIKAIYYTGSGVVVRSGGSSDTNDGASHYELVTPTGSRSPIGVSMGDRIPDFEVDSSRFAYATQDDGTLQVVVHDAAEDRELARVTVLDRTVDSGWEAPRVSIDGDVVWVHLEDGWTEVNWRTGEIRAVPDTQDTYELANGRYAVQRGHVWEIRAMADESTVGTVDLPKGWYAFFSPDGRYLRGFPNAVKVGPGPPSAFGYEVATGASHRHVAAGYDLGWTPDGHLLVLDGRTVSVCEVLTDSCERRADGLGSGSVKLGGNPYES